MAVLVQLLLVQLLLVAAAVVCATVKANTTRSFPSGFKFGAATAAYQIEGGWNEDGKGWSSWDYLVRTDPGHIVDGTNGDVAANSYHLYKRDVQMLKQLGATAYRFSISWPRILPYGRPNYVNPLGVAYYNNLINELLDNGIEPFPTMYHWDLPQNLAEQGGLLSDDFQEWFGDYARVLYQYFGDRVKHWMTINEPYIHCRLAYGIGVQAPRVFSPGSGFYDCGRNILLANARAYKIYDDEGFRASQGGQLGIVFSGDWAYPSTDSEDDAEAVIDYHAFHLHQYMNPVFGSEGNYPQRMIDRVAAASAAQGLNSSRLRPFTQEQVNYIRGTADFLALNHYTTDMVYRNSSVAGMDPIPSMQDDAYFMTYKHPSWPTSESDWLSEYAPGLHKLLVYIKDTYNSPTIYITENGFSTQTGLVDESRVQYIRNYLTAIQEALADEVDVKGYFAWSLMDNFEWVAGHSVRFGLYEVDMADPDRRRTPRKSALVYKEIIRSGVIDFSYNPDPYAATDDAYSTTTSVLTVITFAIVISQIFCDIVNTCTELQCVIMPLHIISSALHILL